MPELNIAPHDLPLCDIVMDGGVTSGIVYPKATVKLSEKFRIKNIGGTSAGAIAAAATAAAELGRLLDPAGNPGYMRLSRLPDELSGKGFSSEKATRLQDLFQPQDKTRPLYEMLIAALNKKSKWSRFRGLAWGALRSFCWRALAAFALSVVISAVIFIAIPETIAAAIAAAILTAISAVMLTMIFGRNNLFTLIAALIVALIVTPIISLILISVVAVVACSIYRTLTVSLVDNGYGICKGYDTDAVNLPCGDVHEPLTLWLSRLLNECAGKDPDGPPLTFGELWAGTGDEKSAPPKWLQDAGLKEWRYIDLQMISTNVTHGRPYRFPFKDNDQKLYFKEDELSEWFPPNVIQHMVAKAGKPIQGKYPLPEPEHLPVVFATRLSLSFPFLLSAVPLYAKDFENPKAESQKIERCWFSDGGICSNFPIHFFDAPLPMWPTFGIALESELTRYWPIEQDLKTNPIVSKDDRSRFFLPPKNKDGRGDSWARFDEAPDGEEKLLGFASGLLNAARNWRDRMLTRAPGVRDRVVRVYLKDDEGGLNLNMDKNLIKGLSSVGEVAASMLTERFSPESSDPMNLDNHRWVRLRNLAAVAEQDLSTLHRSIAAVPPKLRHWSNLINASYPKNEDQYPIDSAQEQKLNVLLRDLETLSKNSFDAPTMKDQGAPKRMPVIRIIPNI